MLTKLISCSFEKGSIGGFMTICNGVNFGKEGHYSKTVAVTKEAFLAACKDRVLFSDILGVDICAGWQNALAEAIRPFACMKEECDAQEASETVAKLDIKIRGEDKVIEDMEALEKENEKLTEAVKDAKIRKKPVRVAVKKQPKPKEETNDDRPTESTDNSIENAGSETDSRLSVEPSSSNDNEA